LGGEEARFASLFDEYGQEVLAFALRRLGNADDAADVVSETFLVAWRRSGDVPEGEEARLWLFGVARRVLANLQRGERRASSLSQRLRSEMATVAPPGLGDKPPGPALRALAQLEDEDQELLLLVGWEELKPGEVAEVLGISPLAARSRLFRARRKLRDQLGKQKNAVEPSQRNFGLEDV
jgi:RNA polymerase sigma-70 factor (ECF subfamily)